MERLGVSPADRRVRDADRLQLQSRRKHPVSVALGDALCGANIVYWLYKELDGDLDRVVRIAKLTVVRERSAGL